MKITIKMTSGKCVYCHHMVNGSDIDNHVTTCNKSPYYHAQNRVKMVISS